MYGIYIHIPFCIKKCLYCDFASYTGKSHLYEQYLDSLIAEMKEYKNAKADSVFVGGGTPSVLSARLLEKLLYNVHDIFDLDKNSEISIEVNPKTLDSGKISVLKKYVNRVSMGAQSFNDKELKAIGRIHSAKEAYESAALIRDNFENFNIDLMSSLPYQTAESFFKSLDTALSLSPAHISCYSLIVEENTPMYNMVQGGTVTLPDDDYDRDIYARLKDCLAQNEYERYEISNYAKSGFECVHNIKYWDTEEYLGFGAAAHSYAGGRRFFNSPDISEYMRRTGGGEEILTRSDMISEFVFMGMRKTAGISKDEFRRRFSEDIYDVYADVLREKIEKGLIIENRDRLYLSDRGIDISNYVLCDFII